MLDRLAGCALGLILLSLPASAVGKGGTNAAEFLRLGSGAYAPAVGDAMTAGAEGSLSMAYNPAGLGWSVRTEVSASYQNLSSMASYGDLAASWRFHSDGGLGAQVRYIDYGNTSRTTISTPGGIATAMVNGTYSAHDNSGAIGYGHRFGNWSAGVAAKVVSLEIDNVPATAFAADLGLQWRPAEKPYRLGISVQNLGSQLTFDRVKEDLPLLGRIGGELLFMESRVKLHGDVEWARNEAVKFMGGGEFAVTKNLSLRAGYDGRIDVDKGFTAGIGLNVNNFTLDYAYIPFGDLGDNHRVGMTYGF